MPRTSLLPWSCCTEISVLDDIQGWPLKRIGLISATEQAENDPDRRNRKNPVQPGQLRSPCCHQADHKQHQKTSKGHRLILNEGDTAGLLLQMSSSIENCFKHLFTIQLKRELLQGEGDISTGRQNGWRDLFNGNR